jgi:hypothetical protein
MKKKPTKEEVNAYLEMLKSSKNETPEEDLSKKKIG